MSTVSKIALSAVGALVVVVVGAFVTVRLGVYNIAADDEHTRPVHALLESVRERSILARARQVTVPNLKDPARTTQGAGNYSAMCAGCHLAPGAEPSELSRGLYPAPPNLSRAAVDPAEAFWVIKHGIKASGMPAWGKSMEDGYIWNMVAFLEVMPTLDAAAYERMVAQSGGHSHGGMEDRPHSHGSNADPASEHRDMGGKPHSHGGSTEESSSPAPSDSSNADAAAQKPAKPAHTHPPGTKPHHD